MKENEKKLQMSTGKYEELESENKKLKLETQRLTAQNELDAEQVIYSEVLAEAVFTSLT